MKYLVVSVPDKNFGASLTSYYSPRQQCIQEWCAPVVEVSHLRFQHLLKICTQSTNYVLLGVWVHSCTPWEAQRHATHRAAPRDPAVLSLQVIARLGWCLPSAWHWDVNSVSSRKMSWQQQKLGRRQQSRKNLFSTMCVWQTWPESVLRPWPDRSCQARDKAQPLPFARCYHPSMLSMPAELTWAHKMFKASLPALRPRRKSKI